MIAHASSSSSRKGLATKVGVSRFFCHEVRRDAYSLIYAYVPTDLISLCDMQETKQLTTASPSVVGHTHLECDQRPTWSKKKKTRKPKKQPESEPRSEYAPSLISSSDEEEEESPLFAPTKKKKTRKPKKQPESEPRSEYAPSLISSSDEEEEYAPLFAPGLISSSSGSEPEYYDSNSEKRTKKKKTRKP